jgi:hypothetical protein
MELSPIQRLLRAVYGIEFLIALFATFEFWSEVGGQSHLDLMPWWWKALLSSGVAASVVKLTVSSVRKQTLIWIAVLALLLFAGGMVTYYYHLNEPRDQDDEQGQIVPTALRVSLQIDFELPRSIGKLHQQSAVVL